MAESLVLIERVKNTIQLGESHFREFKSALEGPQGAKRPRSTTAICRDIGEALVAFANADGGDLLIGVEDDGSVTGIRHSQADRATLLAAPNTHVKDPSSLPLNVAAPLEIDGHHVLYFSVGKGSSGVLQLHDGRCVRRSGTSTVPASISAILFDQAEQRSRRCDSEFIDGLTLADLDSDLIQSLADRYLRGLNPEKYLQQIGLAEYGPGGLRLRRVTALLFARDVAPWHPRCQVRILRVEGTQLRAGTSYNVVSDEAVLGNILTLLRRSWDVLRPFLSYKTELGVDARFEQRYLYPEGACREALVNAIAHRDYSVQNGVEVFLFDDRMEIRSPGSLLSTMSVDQLMRLDGAHESRNALVARVLRETGFMQELGEGMKRIFSLMEESDLNRPELLSADGEFRVTLFHKSVFSDRQLAWLEMFSVYGLTRRQQRIVVAGMDDHDLSPADIYAAMKTEDRDTYDREVTGLRNRKILTELHTSASAKRMARSTGRPKGKIPRFKVVRPEPPQDESASHGNTIAVFGLPLNAARGEVEALFKKFGRVRDVRMPQPKPNAATRFGFVEFSDPASAFAVLTSTDRLRMKDRELSVRKANPRESQ